jgi:hypothetical protein
MGTEGEWGHGLCPDLREPPGCLRGRVPQNRAKRATWLNFTPRMASAVVRDIPNSPLAILVMAEGLTPAARATAMRGTPALSNDATWRRTLAVRSGQAGMELRRWRGTDRDSS